MRNNFLSVSQKYVSALFTTAALLLSFMATLTTSTANADSSNWGLGVNAGGWANILGQDTQLAPYQVQLQSSLNTLFFGPVHTEVSDIFLNSASSKYDFFASLGRLGATAISEVHGFGSAGATVFIQSVDTFTVTSGSLSLGTPAELALTFNLHGLLSTPYRFGPAVYLHFLICQPTSGCIEQYLNLDRSLPGPQNLGQTVILNIGIGGTFTVAQDFFVGTDMDYGESGIQVADALNTATFTVASLTPGATYGTASGHVYDPITPVPESSSDILIGLGLIALMATRLRLKVHVAHI